MPRTLPKLFFDPITLKHDNGAGHPERPGRLRAIREHLEARFPDVIFHRADPAERAEIERFHDPSYVDHVLSLKGRQARLDPDTALSPDSVDAALAACGMTIAAIDSAIAGVPSFALVRPPGHHAERARGMGFCLFGNVAIAADRATDHPDIERVLVIDWDVHHGNGTQNAFYNRSDVLFFSTHQSPFYPGTGAVRETGRGEGRGHTINVPLPAGSGDAALSDAFRTILRPIADEYAPDLVILSAGFDAHCLDPLGGMQVTTDGFGILCDIVQRIAADHCDGRLALVLEGGYHLDALAKSVVRCVELMSGMEINGAPADEAPIVPARSALEEARRVHEEVWPL